MTETHSGAELLAVQLLIIVDCCMSFTGQHKCFVICIYPTVNSSLSQFTCVSVESGPGQGGESRRESRLHPADEGLHQGGEERRDPGDHRAVVLKQLQQPEQSQLNTTHI